MLCQEFVLCVLRLKGYEILEYDVEGYDILAHYPGGLYDYYIEVKCGPSAELSPTQEDKRNEVMHMPNARYVVCQFDDNGNLIEDEMCERLLGRYLGRYV